MWTRGIPNIYKSNSRENRLKLLAGMIDSTFQQFNIEEFISAKNPSEDVIFLIRSLGFPCFYNNNIISFPYSEEIPIFYNKISSNNK